MGKKKRRRHQSLKLFFMSHLGHGTQKSFVFFTPFREKTPIAYFMMVKVITASPFF